MWHNYCELTRESFKAMKQLNRFWIIGWIFSGYVFVKWMVATGFAICLGFNFLLIKALLLGLSLLICLIIYIVRIMVFVAKRALSKYKLSRCGDRK